MSKKIQGAYLPEAVNNNVWDLIVQANRPRGVHLDIGCGFGAVGEVAQGGYDYVGIDENENTVAALRENGLEAYHCKIDNKYDTLEFLRGVLGGRPLAQATALSFIGHKTNPGKVLESLRELLVEFDAPLIFSMPNIACLDVALNLMGGDFDCTPSDRFDVEHVSFCTEKSILRVMDEYGFVQTGALDYHFERSDRYYEGKSGITAENSKLRKGLTHIKSIIDPNVTVSQFVRAFLPLEQQQAPEETQETRGEIFLSVVMRTQGTRIEMLREALNCLSRQTNTDFELLIMAHKVAPENLERVRIEVQKTPRWLREKIRIEPVDYGNRTVPLNAGFELSRGKYISIFDDDDLLYENWVDTFFQLSQTSDGCILHTYTLDQQWEAISREGQETTFSAVDEGSEQYCRDFNYINQVARNHCPIMSLAFPADVFHEWEVKFDESLTTVEDWDYLMRVAALCQVADSATVTSVYRRWVNLPNASTQHDMFEWKRNEDRVRKKIASGVSLLLPKEMQQLTDHLLKTDAASPEEIETRSYSLYLDCGTGFSEQMRKSLTVSDYSPEIKLTFGALSGCGTLRALRFDPTEKQEIVVKSCEINVIFTDGRRETFALGQLETNGTKYYDGVVFLFPDPQILIELRQEGAVGRVEITAEVHHQLPEDMYSQLYECLRRKRFVPKDGRAVMVDEKLCGERFSLYFSVGDSFSEERVVCETVDVLEKQLVLEFKNTCRFSGVNFLRFVPPAQGGFLLENFKVTVQYADDSQSIIEAHQVTANGVVSGNRIFFPDKDPQIEIPVWMHEEPETVTAEFSITHFS